MVSRKTKVLRGRDAMRDPIWRASTLAGGSEKVKHLLVLEQGAMLLAVDLGLKTAWSVWDSEGRLCRFESRNFSNRRKLKSGVPTIIRSLPPIEVLVAEGDARLAKVWFGFNKLWETELVQAQIWRRDVLHPREQRTGSLAKGRAIEMAADIIRCDQCGRPDGLNHDTAEAILLGYWAVVGRGWRVEG